MSGPAAIFDTALHRRRLARAVARGPADFLLTRAAEDVAERLETVQRSFARIADIGTPGPALAAALAARWPAAQVVWLGPTTPSMTFATEGAVRPLPPCGEGTGMGVRQGLDPAALAQRREPPPLAPPHKGEGEFPGRYALTVADPERLPLAAGSLDLAVSALALQSANDLPGALVQIRGALKPDGLFLAAMLGGRTLHELRAVLTQAETEITGGVSPRVAPFADVRDMGGLLQRAGFALPVADSEALTVRYDHLFALMTDLRAMGATNALVDRSRRPAPRALFLRAAALYQARFADADGRIRATFEIVSLSGWAPHESQQRPARRGSGAVSLAAALGDRAAELSSKS